MNDQITQPVLPARGRQKGLAGGAGSAVRTGEGAHPRRGHDCGGAPAAADGGGRRHDRGDRSSRTDHDPRRLRRSQAAHRVLPRLVARPTGRRAMRGMHVLQQPGSRAVLHPLSRRHVRHALQGSLRGECPLPGLPGLGHAVVLGGKTAPQLLEGRDWQRHHLVFYVRDGERMFETYYTGGRGVEIMAPTHGLLDMTVYGRQETWEQSPDGWPQPWGDARPRGLANEWTPDRPMVPHRSRPLRQADLRSGMRSRCPSPNPALAYAATAREREGVLLP